MKKGEYYFVALVINGKRVRAVLKIEKVKNLIQVDGPVLSEQGPVGNYAQLPRHHQFAGCNEKNVPYKSGGLGFSLDPNQVAAIKQTAIDTMASGIQTF
ncbi:hypothetical protein ACFL2U_02835 [Patescibacteria group bacterium]